MSVDGSQLSVVRGPLIVVSSPYAYLKSIDKVPEKTMDN